MSGPIPIWLDCDPGHDDAIAMLLSSFLTEQFNLLGISTVHGNATLQDTTRNALSLLTAYGKTDIKVYPGASKPLERTLHIAQEIHGESGLDGTDLLPTAEVSAQPDDSATDAIIAAIEAHPGEIAICATGTLTNLAIVMEKRPDLLPKIKQVSIMGGGIKIGNWSGEFAETNVFNEDEMYAEFNIWCDPHAAKRVLTHSVLAPKVLLVPLDVTHTAIATSQVLDTVKGEGSSSNPLRVMLFELLTFFRDTYRERMGFTTGPPVHDPLAVAGLIPMYGIHNDLDMQSTRYKMDVVLTGTHAGQTLCVEQDDNGVAIMESINVDNFWKLVYTAIDRCVTKK